MILLIAVLLFSFTLATGISWHQIYVSSSNGTDSSSCWTGSVPCNTLNLALQGVQHNSTVIYLYPGIYTLNDEVQVSNISRVQVAIIGLSDDVTISCRTALSGQWSDNIFLQCVTIKNCPAISNSIKPCPYNMCPNTELDIKLHFKAFIFSYDNYVRPGEIVTFDALFKDYCSNREYVVKHNLTICIASDTGPVKICSSDNNCTSNNAFSLCYFGEAGDVIYSSPINIDIMISMTTLNVSTTRSLKMTRYCYDDDPYVVYIFNSTNGKCELVCNWRNNCRTHNSAPICYFESMFTDTCASNRTGILCGSCDNGYSVPINVLSLYECVQCDDALLILKNWGLFITVQLLPVTALVLLIIVLNIQLTSGSINGLILYSQILTTVYPGLTFNKIFGLICLQSDFNTEQLSPLLLIPLNVFNLDFTWFFYNYPLCVSSSTTPLGALSFGYVIGLYPLLFLLLLYGWIMLYHNGVKVIVYITRPTHHLLARFWRMTNIEPSLLHSVASVYLLSVMQLAATSLKILHPSFRDGKVTFFYDGSLDYFGWPHCVAGIFAILVLILLVLLPMLYIQLYPLKPFHKLLKCLHLTKWQALTSLGDIFTAPYKNGTSNKFDYRYFAGVFLLLRVIILLLHFIPFSIVNVPAILQVCLFIPLCAAILLIRPYQRNINSFRELFIFLFLGVLGIVSAFLSLPSGSSKFMIALIICSFNGFVLVFIMLIYFIYWTVKKIRTCYKFNRPQTFSGEYDVSSHILEDESVTDDNWIADRMINPQDYNEQHFQLAPYQYYYKNQEAMTTLN